MLAQQVACQLTCEKKLKKVFERVDRCAILSYSIHMIKNEIKAGIEAIADDKRVIVLSVENNDVLVISEDGEKFEIDIDLVLPIISIAK